MSLKALGIALAVALGATMAPAGIAKEADLPPQVLVSPEEQHLAQSLIEEALQASHLSEIYADLRATLRDVYLPTLRDAIQGDLPGFPAPDPKTAAMMAKSFTFLDYSRRAGDELEAALAENRKAMISDAATILARSATPPEIVNVRALVNLPAVRKGFDTFYALTRLVTGFSYSDSRSFSEFSAWVKNLDLDMSQGMPSAPGHSQGPPSQHKIAQAEVVFSDLLRVSHLDDIVANVKRFARDVYAETAPLSDEERQDLRDQIDQFEFTYNLQKSVALAAAPSVIAAALTEDQLTTMSNFIKSQPCIKAFDLFYNLVKAGTAFTKEDILAAQKAFGDLDRQSKVKERTPEERDRASADWKAFSDKWSEILRNRLSSETRSGLQKSLDALQGTDQPI